MKKLLKRCIEKCTEFVEQNRVIWQRLAMVGAFIITVPILFQIHRGSTLFNPLSYLLWSTLGCITGIVFVRAQKGGHQLMFAYGACDVTVAMFAGYMTKKLVFGWFEFLVLGLIAVCIVIWMYCENQKLKQKKGEEYRPAVIANATSLMVAGIPQMISVWQRPEDSNVDSIAIGYFAISLFSYLGEKSFNGRLVPVLSMMYWVIVMVPVIVMRAIGS